MRNYKTKTKLQPMNEDYYSFGSWYQDNKQWVNPALTVAGTVGGAAIGSVIPGLGTGVGAMLGSSIGGSVAGLAGTGIDAATQQPIQNTPQMPNIPLQSSPPNQSTFGNAYGGYYALGNSFNIQGGQPGVTDTVQLPMGGNFNNGEVISEAPEGKMVHSDSIKLGKQHKELLQRPEYNFDNKVLGGKEFTPATLATRINNIVKNTVVNKHGDKDEVNKSYQNNDRFAKATLKNNERNGKNNINALSGDLGSLMDLHSQMNGLEVGPEGKMMAFGGQPSQEYNMNDRRNDQSSYRAIGGELTVDKFSKGIMRDKTNYSPELIKLAKTLKDSQKQNNATGGPQIPFQLNTNQDLNWLNSLQGINNTMNYEQPIPSMSGYDPSSLRSRTLNVYVPQNDIESDINRIPKYTINNQTQMPSLRNNVNPNIQGSNELIPQIYGKNASSVSNILPGNVKYNLNDPDINKLRFDSPEAFNKTGVGLNTRMINSEIGSIPPTNTNITGDQIFQQGKSGIPTAAIVGAAIPAVTNAIQMGILANQNKKQKRIQPHLVSENKATKVDYSEAVRQANIGKRGNVRDAGSLNSMIAAGTAGDYGMANIYAQEGNANAQLEMQNNQANNQIRQYNAGAMTNADQQNAMARSNYLNQQMGLTNSMGAIGQTAARDYMGYKNQQQMIPFMGTGNNGVIYGQDGTPYRVYKDEDGRQYAQVGNEKQYLKQS